MTDKYEQHSGGGLDQPAHEPESPRELKKIYDFLGKAASGDEGLTVEVLFDVREIGRIMLKQHEYEGRMWSVCASLTRDTESELHAATIGEVVADEEVISPIIGEIDDIVVREDDALALVVESCGVGQGDRYTIPIAYCGDRSLRSGLPMEILPLVRAPLEERLSEDELESVGHFYANIEEWGMSGDDVAELIYDHTDILPVADVEAYILALNLEFEDAYSSGHHYSVLLNDTAVRVMYDHQLPGQEPEGDWIDDGTRCSVVRLVYAKDTEGEYANLSVVVAPEDNDRLLEVDLYNTGVSFHRPPSEG